MTDFRESENERPQDKIARKIKYWLARYRQRKLLLQLDEHALKDIGISRADAVFEGEKPFWKE